jgi:hypothetical protein
MVGVLQYLDFEHEVPTTVLLPAKLEYRNFSMAFERKISQFARSVTASPNLPGFFFPENTKFLSDIFSLLLPP